MSAESPTASVSAVPGNAFRAYDRLYKCVKAPNGKYIQPTDFSGVLDVRAMIVGSASPSSSCDVFPCESLAARVFPVAERRADGSWAVHVVSGFDAGWAYEAPEPVDASADNGGRSSNGTFARKGPADPPLPSRAFDVSLTGGGATRIYAIRNAPGLFVVSRALTHAQQFLWALRALTQYADADYTNLSNLHGADRDRVSELFWRCCRENLDAAAAAAAEAPAAAGGAAPNNVAQTGSVLAEQRPAAARMARDAAADAPLPAGAEVKRHRALAHVDLATIGAGNDTGTTTSADTGLAPLASMLPPAQAAARPRPLLPRPCACAPSPLGVASLAEYLNWGTAAGAPGAYRPCLPTDCELLRVRARLQMTGGSAAVSGSEAETDASTSGGSCSAPPATAEACTNVGIEARATGDNAYPDDVGCACGPGGCGRTECHVTTAGSEQSVACCGDPWCVTRAHPGLSTASSRALNFSRLAPLRWASLGYRYDWTAREYGENSAAPLPPELSTVTQEFLEPLVQAGLVPQSTPEAALVNFYPLSSSMGAHIDDAEPAVRRPIVSFSLGSSAVFLVGSASRAAAPLALLLHSGDAIIQAGPARRAFHAVPRIIERSCPVRALHAAGARLLRAAEAVKVVKADEDAAGGDDASVGGSRVSAADVEEFRGLISQCAPQMRAYGVSAETVVDFVLCTLGEYRLNFNTRQVADEGAMLPSEVRKHFPVNAVIGGIYADVR